jgi:hypothetical protein
MAVLRLARASYAAGLSNAWRYGGRDGHDWCFKFDRVGSVCRFLCRRRVVANTRCDQHVLAQQGRQQAVSQPRVVRVSDHTVHVVSDKI